MGALPYEQKFCVASTAYPDELHDIEEVSFQVNEYYKGAGPPTISVMIDQGSHQLNEGISYVLFLFRSNTPEGRAYWNNGCLIQGAQGLWAVDGSATRQMGEVNQYGKYRLEPMRSRSLPNRLSMRTVLFVLIGR